jgi:alcohol dehydrogenase, propanol-preferring
MNAPWLAMELAAPGRALQAVWRERAWPLQSAHTGAPTARRLPYERAPQPGPGQVRLRVAACGVCRTDLHLADGDLAHPGRPIVPGHEVVGRIDALGDEVHGLALGQRVGVPWLGWTCGVCAACRAGRENLCAQARFTDWQIDGGYAEHCIADARYVFALPDRYGDDEAAPLLCAGLIGWRAYAAAGAAQGPPQRLGLYGFGAAAHLIAQVVLHHGHDVFAFTRAGDAAAQAWRANSAWPGPAPPTSLPRPLRVHTHRYPLTEAQRALDDLRAGRFSGAAVLLPSIDPALSMSNRAHAPGG